MMHSQKTREIFNVPLSDYVHLLPAYISSGLLGLAAPLLLYQHSNFFGWSAPRGGELAVLVAFLFVVALTFYFARKNFAQALIPIALSAGLIVGSLAPWVEHDPFWAKGAVPTPEQIWDVKRVAHAGGAIRGLTYTNSIEAMNLNSDYFVFFELDFQATTDDQLVCLHAWGEEIHQEIFGQILPQPVSFEEFKSLNRKGSLTACTMPSLEIWLANHPDAKIVTDVKDARNVLLLGSLLDSHPAVAERMIPQAYSIKEIYQLKELGFKDVILTTYRIGNFVESEFVRDIELAEPFAVTMSSGQAGQLSWNLNSLGIPTYVYTVNDHRWFAELRKFGVSNIYTDTLNDTLDGF